MNEIEEFLKRAAAMRAKTAAARQSPSQPGAGPAERVPSSRAPSSLAPSAGQTPPPTRVVLDAEVVEAEPVTGDDVAEFVQRHLDNRRFEERATRLGASVKSTDEVIESHLHETFEHRLGQLGGMTARAQDSTLDDDERAAARTAAAAAAAQAPPASFAALLKSKSSLRHAVILSEILNPPYSRW